MFAETRGMQYLLGARTGGGRRRFLVHGESDQDALAALKARIQNRQRLTDEFGGLYAAGEIGSESLSVLAGPIPHSSLVNRYRYRVDGTRIE
jgi:hypothetical protein